METIFFGGGCFWGVEHFFKNVDGVVDTSVGYANGVTVDPTYEQVCTGETAYVEACMITYDTRVISLEKLLKYFFTIVDPTSLNKQGGDIGTQYRTGVYFTSDVQESTIKKVVEIEQKKYSEKIVTEILPLEMYYNAEDYHQDYLTKNPEGYCHINIMPKDVEL